MFQVCVFCAQTATIRCWRSPAVALATYKSSTSPTRRRRHWMSWHTRPPSVVSPSIFRVHDLPRHRKRFDGSPCFYPQHHFSNLSVDSLSDTIIFSSSTGYTYTIYSKPRLSRTRLSWIFAQLGQNP